MAALQEPVSIVMPVYNEADIIEEVLTEWIVEVMQKLPAGSEMILDDCSNDGTEKILTRLAAQHPFLHVNFAPRDGYFNSAMRLYRLSKCPLVFATDSDGQYVPAEFWKLVEHIGSYDMVHGCKVGRKDPLYRVWSSLAYNALVRGMFDSRCSDVNSAFRLIRRPMLAAVLDDIRLLKMLPNSEMYIRAERRGFRIKNVGVQHRVRKFGKSRSLPLRTYFTECANAFAGLRALRRDLANSAPAAAGAAALRK